MAYQVYRTSGAIAQKRAQEEQEQRQRNAVAATERAQQIQEGGDLGGILGLIGAGLGAAAIIGTGGIAAAPILALGAIGGAATVGGSLGSAIGKQVASQTPEIAKPTQQQPTQAQKELDIMGAMKSRTQSMMPTLSESTQKLARSVQALGQAPEQLQQEYGDVMLKGLTQSYMKDILNSRRKI